MLVNDNNCSYITEQYYFFRIYFVTSTRKVSLPLSKYNVCFDCSFFCLSCEELTHENYKQCCRRNKKQFTGNFTQDEN